MSARNPPPEQFVHADRVTVPREVGVSAVRVTGQVTARRLDQEAFAARVTRRCDDEHVVQPRTDCRAGDRRELPDFHLRQPLRELRREGPGCHVSFKKSHVTLTRHIMRTRKTTGQDRLATGSRIATHST
jgi:hypothetical protein